MHRKRNEHVNNVVAGSCPTTVTEQPKQAPHIQKWIWTWSERNRSEKSWLMMNRKLKEKTRIDGEKRTKHDAHTALPLAHCCLHPLSAPCRLSNLINRMRKRTIATHHRKRSTIFKQMYGPTLHQARCCAVQIRKRFLFYSSGKWPQSTFATSSKWKKHS